jgi:hypothetical protein
LALITIKKGVGCGFKCISVKWGARCLP